MKIEGIIWLRDVVDKLALKHQVETHEVEEVLSAKPNICLYFLFIKRQKRY
jgi:energy-converting hydrogenase A subunit M